MFFHVHGVEAQNLGESSEHQDRSDEALEKEIRVLLIETKLLAEYDGDLSLGTRCAWT